MVEGADIIGSPLGLPHWVLPSLSFLVITGFPICLILAWFLEITPAGIRRSPDLTPEQRATQPLEQWDLGTWVMAGVALALVVAGGCFAFLQFRGPRLQEGLLAIFPLENQTGDPTLDHMGSRASDMIAEGILRLDDLEVVGSDELEQALQQRAEGETIRDVAARFRAYVAVSGGFSIEGDHIEFHAEGVDVETGQRIGSLNASGPVLDTDSVLRDIQSRTTGFALLGRSGVVDMDGLGDWPTYEAATAYLQGRRVYQAGNFEAAVPHYREAHRLDTTFLLPVLSQVYVLNERSAQAGPGIWEDIDSLVRFLSDRSSRLAPYSVAGLDGLRAELNGDLEGVLRSAKIFERAAGGKVGHGVPIAALAVGHPGEVLEWLEDFDPFTLMFAWYPFEASALANHWLGRHTEALAQAREGRSHFPQNLLLLRREIQALIALGQIGEIESLLNQLETIDPDEYASPGLVYYRVAGDLAQIGHDQEARHVAERALEWYEFRDPQRHRLAVAQSLLLAGRAGEALSALGSLIEENPDSLPVRGVLGIAHARAGNIDGAVEQARWFEELGTPYLFGEDAYWRAAILAHLGDRDEATRVLLQAHEQGRPWSTPREPLGDIISDPNFRPLWGYAPFEQLIAPRG